MKFVFIHLSFFHMNNGSYVYITIVSENVNTILNSYNEKEGNVSIIVITHFLLLQ